MADPTPHDHPDARHRIPDLDDGAREAFDRLTRLAAALLRAPGAIVCLDDAQPHEFRHEFTASGQVRTEADTRLLHSLCCAAGEATGPLLVNDVRGDARFAGAITDAARVVSYAGVPLTAPEGDALGTLGVYDIVARPWTAEDASLLGDLAAVAAREIVLRTEIRQHVHAEEESAAQLRAVLDALPVGVWLCDAEGRMLRANRATSVIWGGDAPLSASIGEFSKYRARRARDGSPVRPEEWALARVLRSGETVMAEALDITRFDGTEGHVLNSAAPILDGEGEVVGAVAVALDITPQRLAQLEQERLQQALDVERRRLGALFEQAPAFIAWGYGPRHVFAGANRAYYQLVGFRDLIGKPVEEAMPETREQGVIDVLDRVRETGEPFVANGMRLLLQRTPGAEPEERYLNFVYQPIVEADGTRSGIFCHGVDVTEQVRSAMALRASEERLQLLMQNVKDYAIIMLDASGRIESWSEGAAIITGYPAADAIGRPISMLYPEADVATGKPQRELDAAARAGRFEDEGWRMRRDGSRYWANVVTRSLRSDDGTLIGFAKVSRDLTERRAVEEALQRSEERFRLAAEATREVIWEVDLALDTTFWSEAVTTTFGHDRAEMAGVRSWWLDHIHPDDRQRVTETYQAALMGQGREWTHEYRYRRGDGTYAHVLDRGIVARNEAGEPLRMIGSMIDLTDRLEAAAAITFQARLLDAVKQAVIATDTAGRIVTWNEYAEVLYGWTSADAVGRDFVELLHPVSASGVAGELLEQVARGEGWSGECQVRRRNGEVFVALVSLSPVYDAERRLAGAVTVSSDTTEQRQLEEQLRQSQKMEAVGRLAGGVAHDFNNLLTVIKASTSFLLEEIDTVDPRRADVTQIADAAERAAGLTRQLLAFSRKQMLDPKVLDLNTVVRNLQPMLARLIGEDITVETNLRAGLGSIMADVGQLEQVVVNLAVNARDAMPDGGRLSIETADVTLDNRYAIGHAETETLVVLPGEYVMLAVSDTGSGMSADVRARAFEPFFTTKEAGKGTGLGLSTVYGIVKQSGGHVWVYSEPGHGTVFKLYFPRLSAAAATSVRPAASERPARGSETILLVEDEPQLRALCTRILERQGYTVLPSRNGREALALATRHEGQIHLVLTDVVMPEMSGRGLVERLSAVRPQAAVIYMSGYTDDDMLRRGILEEGARFVQKPFAPEVLLRAVRETLDRSA